MEKLLSNAVAITIVFLLFYFMWYREDLTKKFFSSIYYFIKSKIKKK